MAFLSKLDGFYGTGAKDASGYTLEEFLERYDARQYDCPCNTTDVVVVRCKEKLERWGQELELLMIQRKNHPSIGFWAAPGGFVEMREDLYQGAARELFEETGVQGLPLKQLTTWGDYDRDPRWRIITTSFLALAEGDIAIEAGDDAADACWMKVSLEQEDGEGTEPYFKVWKLTLANEERGISVSARIGIKKTSHPLLSQETYELLGSDGIAVDHGCIITQALLYLKGQLEN